MSVAELKSQIQARKFKAMELAAEMDRRAKDIADLMSAYPLVRLKDLKFRLIASLAAESAKLQDEYLQIQKEIEAGEKELAG